VVIRRRLSPALALVPGAALSLAAGALLAACETASDGAARPTSYAPVPGSTSSRPPEAPVPQSPATEAPTAATTAQRGDDAAPGARASDGRPRRATLTIPAIGLHDMPVVPYRGRTDDAPGTAIQDGGVAASPHGPRGGVGPGGIGNYQITAHRTSSTRAFADLPSLRRWQRAVVEAAGVRYVYEIRRTRETSFRSQQSLAEQRAAVPGRPAATPTRAFLTLSTCATPEDHAAGNFWSDEFGNPEHRIDKIGVLVRTADAT
jgi:sortase A